jgi:hypothetical protein
MTYIVENSCTVNGNGGGIVNGRGLRHRKMTRDQAVQLAADVASGRPFRPSVHQSADIFGVPLSHVTKELNARTAARKNTTKPELVVPVVPAVTTEPASTVTPTLKALVQIWHASNPEERGRFVREHLLPLVADVEVIVG